MRKTTNKKQKVGINDADHPLRKKAIQIIEEVIEPMFLPDEGINGDAYYTLEDAIVSILNKK